jgi:hypothetical protein
MRLFLFLVLGLSALGRGDDFWTTWGDGKAEMNGYRLTQPRYGAKREGTAVLIFVAEEMSDSLRVKADPGKHPPADVYPVMKLNFVRRFQTGIYDYDVMTSVFSRIAEGLPVRKDSFSSREWCGQVYHQLLFEGPRIKGVFHSYFDGEADGSEDLPFPKDGILEDELPILLRSFGMARVKEGAKVPFLPSLMRSRLDHRPLSWGEATLSRSSGTGHLGSATVQVLSWTVVVEGGPTLTYHFEAAWPYRLLGWESSSGEAGSLLGTTRLAYWKLNVPGGEVHLKELGLPIPH